MNPSRTRTTLLLTLLSFTLPLAIAQQLPIPMAPSNGATTAADPNPKLPEYDVASVKVNKSGEGNMSWGDTPDGFSCTNTTLKMLVEYAYGIRSDLISGGPGWADSTGFDVQAKVAGEDVAAFKKLTGKQKNVLLQALLADAFSSKCKT